MLVYPLSRSGGRTEVVTLVLTGIAVNAFTGALIGLLIFLARPAARTDHLLAARQPPGAPGRGLAVAPLAVAGWSSRPSRAALDLLALGERPARHLGVNVERLRIVLILSSPS